MKILAQNKKALFNYEVLEQLEGGIILQGWEVKSMKASRVSLKESYIVIRQGRVWLINCHVSKWPGALVTVGMETREREVLLHQNEINRLQKAMSIKGNAIVPLDLHLTGNRVKVQIAFVRGKKQYDKRKVLKRKEQEREMERDLKRMGVVK